MYLVAGLLSGILSAQKAGSGTVVDAAIYDGSAHMMNLLMSLRQTGNLSGTRGRSLLDGPHWSRSYRCADGGHVSVQCLEPQFYADFLDRMGLSADPEFRQQYNSKLWSELTARLEETFAGTPRDFWADLFLGSDACVAPVLSPEEAMAHEMNAARQSWVEIDDVMQAAPAPRFQGQGFL